MIEVDGERFEQGDQYAQITRSPTGNVSSNFAIEQLDGELHEIHMRCQSTGMFARWALTPAQEGTFVELDVGMDPRGFSNKASTVCSAGRSSGDGLTSRSTGCAGRRPRRPRRRTPQPERARRDQRAPASSSR